jgi:hypothetical protein
VLFGLFGNRYTADPEVGATLEYLIERIDRRLALVGGCRRTLGRPAQRVLEFGRSLVAQLPAPLPLRSEGWSSEPRLRAFFARPGDIGEVLARSAGVREYFESGHDEGFAVLGMTRKQTRVLAQALAGEMVQREVPRTSVSFTEHRVSVPCATVEALRTDLERRALDFIAERVAARLESLDTDRKALEQERDVLKARLRLAGRGGHGVESGTDDAALKASLKKCESRLAELAGGLSDRVSIVARTLAAPEKELQLAVHTLRLDQMNFIAEAGDTVSAEVTFVEATASAERSRVLVPVQLFRAELAPRRDALADADKLL